ncbi:MAG: decarboxylating 6-phosphogluconate dehydrogenase [Hyphomicrobiales bacterium]|nr:decarboxylating 6-phosphogluconate dehydrogenase [Methylobacteriaceae bacterium]MCC2100958.1 decarboxylating 6-phosphogluconate dehydrogenase [Hyphomicrobiales bacterium]MCC2104991.1 decarboxylating 6-phosphogluconate dehydrogenase [Hyphomicrobiales bacterium]MCC2106670.1 decarboxylating 6-phosphogluconate dehydrogenase [Hyphomicrobiales bacterium]
MQIGIVGLGRMGANIARRLMRAGHQVVGYNRHDDIVRELAGEGMTPATSLADLVQKLAPPRVIWMMLPSGAITEQSIEEAAGLAASGDVIIDGGNTFWRDDVRRGKKLAGRGLHYMDVGTSGGVWGLERGYCLMIGGEKAVVERLDPIFATLAPGAGDIDRTPGRAAHNPTAEHGYLHCGPVGAGHYVKMVHNGIEYGLMQAYAEGFDLLRHAGDDSRPEEERFAIEVADVAEVWRRGSVVTSWLLDLTATALAKDPALAAFTGKVEDSGEGRWTVQEAVEQATPAPVLTAALFARFRSRQEATFGDKILSAMRKGFGGHGEAK